MNPDKTYLNHCIENAPHVDLRSPPALCLIDGAILGALPVDVEHAYRVFHHRDVAAIKRKSWATKYYTN